MDLWTRYIHMVNVTTSVVVYVCHGLVHKASSSTHPQFSFLCHPVKFFFDWARDVQSRYDISKRPGLKPGPRADEAVMSWVLPRAHTWRGVSLNPGARATPACEPASGPPQSQKRKTCDTPDSGTSASPHAAVAAGQAASQPAPPKPNPTPARQLPPCSIWRFRTTMWGRLQSESAHLN
jgi:hypothetical protein